MTETPHPADEEDPVGISPERETLEEFLEYHRSALSEKSWACPRRTPGTPGTPTFSGSRSTARPAANEGQPRQRAGQAAACQPASASPIGVDGGAATNGQISSEIPRQFAVAFISPRIAKSPRLIRCRIT